MLPGMETNKKLPGRLKSQGEAMVLQWDEAVKLPTVHTISSFSDQLASQSLAIEDLIGPLRAF